MRKLLSVLAVCVATLAVASQSVAEKKAATPLGAWMQQTLAVQGSDTPNLVKNLNKLGGWVPDPAWNEWAAIAKRGVEAAQANDRDGVRASCKACHQKYKNEYIARFATRKPFE